MVGQPSQQGNQNKGKSCVSIERDGVLNRINKIETELNSFWWRVVKEHSVSGVGILLPTLESDWYVEREFCKTANMGDISGSFLT